MDALSIQTLGASRSSAAPKRATSSAVPAFTLPADAPLPPKRPTGVAAASNTGPTEKLLKTAQDFEAVFLESVFERMFSGSEEDGPMGSNGTGGEIWRGQLAQQYARETAKAGGIGIAASVQRELIRLQAGQVDPSTPSRSSGVTHGAR